MAQVKRNPLNLTVGIHKSYNLIMLVNYRSANFRQESLSLTLGIINRVELFQYGGNKR